MYSGNHSPCHPLDTVIEAARRLAGNHEVVFCFVGGGSEFRSLQRMAEVPGGHCCRSGTPASAGSSRPFGGNPPHIRCLPYQPLAGLSASLSAADLHLVTMGNGFVGLVHPCKIYNVLRVAAPLVYIGPEPSPASE